METRLVGDLHGRYDLKHLMVPNSIQLGDLDLFGYDHWSFNDGSRFFIDGNHDQFPKLNPDSNDLQEINKNLFYIPRGFVNGKVLFIGGAHSIDSAFRTPYYDLFNEESLNVRQFNKIRQLKVKIEVVIAHDFPFFMYQKRIKEIWGHSSHAKALSNFFNHFKPKLWINGHHHLYQDDTVNNCRFITVPMNDFMEIDLPLERLMCEC